MMIAPWPATRREFLWWLLIPIGALLFFGSAAYNGIQQARAEEIAGELIEIRFSTSSPVEWINPPELEAELSELERRIAALEARLSEDAQPYFFRCEPPHCTMLENGWVPQVWDTVP